MKRSACSLFSLLFCLLLSRPADGQSSVSPYRHQLKFSPLRLVDPINPGAELSFERLLDHRNSLQVSYAYMTDPFGTAYPYTHYKGHRFAAEQKRFLTNKRGERFYASLELVYSTVHYPTVGWFEKKGAGNDTATVYRPYADSIHLYRRTLSLNGRAGYHLFFFKHFVWDVAVGFGLKYRNVLHGGRLIPDDVLVPPRHPNAHYMAEQAGKSVTVNLPFTFKIGYAF